MKKQILFKIEINNLLLTEYEINKNNSFLFNIGSEVYTLKKLCDSFELKLVCDECGSKTVVKNIQQHIKLNKKYLCRSCRCAGDRNGMFNKTHNKETLGLLSKKQTGSNNHFYGKKHSDETILKQRESKIGKYDGEKNPMYGKTYFDIWVDKYGVDIALVKLSERNKKQAKSISGQKNPMYGKSILDVWNEKYGADKTNELYSEWLSNIKKSLTKLYEGNDELKYRISESLKGRVFTDNHKLNLRLSSIEYIKRKLELNGGKMVPHFNIYACQLFDEISKIKNINIQHALNGGEYYISELGYWVDGYDQKNNVVYEYYEREHRKSIEKDFIREIEIKEYLKCDFIIIHENKETEFLNILI